MKPSARLRNLHFTGIGGAGMSALAGVFHASGFVVRGSDRVGDGPAQRWLRGLGVPVLAGHAGEHVAPECDALVYTAAVEADNPELSVARARGVPVVRRAELLGIVLSRRHGLAVAGTHGKSTATGMLIHILGAAGTDPGWAVGAAWKDGAPGHAGGGEFFAVEADEYDRAFLSLRPVSALVTNIDSDHLDTYGSLEAVDGAFAEFLNRLPFHGTAVVNAEDAGVRRILERLECRVRTFGLSGGDYRARDVGMQGGGSVFTLWRDGESLGSVRLRVFGDHNVSNALAAAALAMEEGVPFEAVAEGLSRFSGMHRRLESIGVRGGVTVIDDYAHHPAEVAAALRAARLAVPGKLAVIFQPHLYSRTRRFAPEFAAAFLACEHLLVLPVYAARETPLPGSGGDLIAREAGRMGHVSARYVETPEAAVREAARLLRSGDACLTMGAGDVGELAPAVLEALS